MSREGIARGELVVLRRIVALWPSFIPHSCSDFCADFGRCCGTVRPRSAAFSRMWKGRDVLGHGACKNCCMPASVPLAGIVMITGHCCVLGASPIRCLGFEIFTYNVSPCRWGILF